MKTSVSVATQRRAVAAPYCHALAAWFAAAILGFSSVAPSAKAQWAPPGVAVGSTPATSLRYAAAAVRDQASMVRKSAQGWGRNASQTNYRTDQFAMDFHTMQLQMQVLRERFAWMAALAFQVKGQSANNALAELDAGLNIIGELLLFLDQQFAAGTLDRATLVRTCRAFEDAMREWELELRKSNGRLGVIW